MLAKAANVIEQTTFEHKGRTLTAFLLRTQRIGGRRIVIQEHGKTVFDTDDQYDHGNACNRAEIWLDQQ